MKRIDALFSSYKVRYPDDVATLKSSIPELAAVNDFVVELMYRNWSEEYFCAGWLILSPHIVNEFAEYLREDILEDSDDLGFW